MHNHRHTTAHAARTDRHTHVLQDWAVWEGVCLVTYCLSVCVWVSGIRAKAVVHDHIKPAAWILMLLCWCNPSSVCVSACVCVCWVPADTAEPLPLLCAAFYCFSHYYRTHSGCHCDECPSLRVLFIRVEALFHFIITAETSGGKAGRAAKPNL